MSILITSKTEILFTFLRKEGLLNTYISYFPTYWNLQEIEQYINSISYNDHLNVLRNSVVGSNFICTYKRYKLLIDGLKTDGYIT